jgi:hypothetical protein
MGCSLERGGTGSWEIPAAFPKRVREKGNSTEHKKIDVFMRVSRLSPLQGAAGRMFNTVSGTHPAGCAFGKTETVILFDKRNNLLGISEKIMIFRFRLGFMPVSTENGSKPGKIPSVFP